MPIGPGLPGFNLNAQSIQMNTPAASGVYAIYNANQWIYFGETNDIQRRLLEHVNDAGHCMWQYGPTAFTFELQIAPSRSARQNALILAYPTPCNQRFG